MGDGGQTPEGPPGKAVPGTLAQPPQPRRQEVLVDSGGRPRHLQGPLRAGKPLGGDRQTAARKVSELIYFHNR